MAYTHALLGKTMKKYFVSEQLKKWKKAIQILQRF